jgi:FtsP/CotA-like multicopper oxidase with cupredoxin domain
VLVRRITLALCALFLVTVVAAAFADREAQTTRATAPAPTLPSGPPQAVVSGSLPRDRTVRAHVGDAVTVAVRSSTPDDAWISELGVTAPTSSDVPGQLEFVATQPGRYAVQLVDSGTTAGTIQVLPPAP